MTKRLRALQSFFREPLFRLLAINLAIGITAAVLLLAGFLILNPYGLRDLIVADRAPVTALLLLLFGFVVTFGSVAMGTAIMTLGQSEDGGGNRAGREAPVVGALLPTIEIAGSPIAAPTMASPMTNLAALRRLQAGIAKPAPDSAAA